MSKIDWSIFDREYPVKDGIVDALPESLDYPVEANRDATQFKEVHLEVMKGRNAKDLLTDKDAMAKIQKDFYDRMAVGFQHMDDTDQASGGIFWWKIRRCAKYDESHFRGRKLLFVGSGNCRLARIFAQMGYDVTATDISMNMLRIGKEVNDKLGVKMTYVAHNAEIPFPFKSEQFSTAYSLCVINHIVDWRNYLLEKMRCLRPSGVLLERMPNVNRWSLWSKQAELYDGVEMKAKYCTPQSANQILDDLELQGKVWTHDRQEDITCSRWLPLRAVNRIDRRLFLWCSKQLYTCRSSIEDHVWLPLSDDGQGIYTLFKIVKD